MPAKEHACRYLEVKGDGRPGSTWHYCNHRAAQVTPTKGTCTETECDAFTLAGAPAAPADPQPAAVGGSAVSPPQVTGPDAVAAPAAPPTSIVGGATGPDISPPKEQPAMPAAKSRTKKIEWTAPAQSVFADAPQDLTLRGHVRNLVNEHKGERGYVPALARQLDIHPNTMLSAIGALKPKAAPAAKPKAAPVPPDAVSDSPSPAKARLRDQGRGGRGVRTPFPTTSPTTPASACRRRSSSSCAPLAP